MSGYPPNQSPMAAPSPAGRGYGGYGQQPPPMQPQGYGQMPPSAGGYRPDQMQSAYGAPQSAGGYHGQPQSAGGYQPAGQNGQYGGYQP